MHCPGCGQRQVSSETKFCSKCGLPLSLVSDVLAHGGYLPQLAELNNKKTVFNKKNGVVLSVFWFIFFTMFMTAFFAILGAPEELVAILAITGVFGGMMTMIASLIFLKSSRRIAPIDFQIQGNLPGGSARHGSLPPQQSVPASVYATPLAGNWRDTNDLQPTSVTEGTTKLLDKDDI